MIVALCLEALSRLDGTIIIERKVLYEALRTGGFQTILLSLDTDRERVTQTLERARVEHDLIVNKPKEWALDDRAWKVHAVTNLLASSFRVTYYLDTDEQVCALMRKQGITTLLLEGRAPMFDQALAQVHVAVPWDEVSQG